MSTKYLFAAIQAKTNDPIAKIILIYLADSANQDGQCYPAHSTIAEMCETSVKTVKRKLDDLCVMGFIEWENRGRKGFKTSNLYQLCEPEVFLYNGMTLDSPRRIKNAAKTGHTDPKIGHTDLTDRSQGAIEPITKPITTTTTRPKVDEVAEYVKTRDVKIDAQQFIDYYSANGWKVGRNPMKDWKAAIRTWERREKPKPTYSPKQSCKQTSIESDLSDRSWA